MLNFCSWKLIKNIEYVELKRQEEGMMNLWMKISSSHQRFKNYYVGEVAMIHMKM
jgi:hypothetical protein